MNTGAFRGKFHFHYSSSDLWTSYNNFPNILPSNENHVEGLRVLNTLQKQEFVVFFFNTDFRLTLRVGMAKKTP